LPTGVIHGRQDKCALSEELQVWYLSFADNGNEGSLSVGELIPVVLSDSDA